MTARKIEYDDIDALRSTLIGRKIVGMERGTESGFGLFPPSWRGAGMDAIKYTLDDGTLLYAVDTDGGCACSNGCFAVEASDEYPSSVITAVDQVEEADGSESAHIRLFVYTEGIKTELLNSYGGDNGYYGWGHAIYIERAVVE